MEKILKDANLTMAMKHLTEGEAVSYDEAEKLIKDPETFAKRIEAESRELQPGLELTQETIELGEGHFANKYDLKFGVDSRANIITGTDFFYQHRLFHPKNRNSIQYGTPAAVINGPFFYLEDEKTENAPQELMYNLNIRNGKVIGLPSASREAIMVNLDGKLQAKKLLARGSIQICNNDIDWVGGEAVAHRRTDISEYADSNTTILFNSACCTIAYDDPKDKKSLRRLRKDLNQTPIREGVDDLVVSVNPDNGELYISEINEGGGTDFFKGTFILQTNKQNSHLVKVGSVVEPTFIDDVRLSDVASAITVGPSVHHFLENSDHDINHDQSLGTFPPFSPNQRYARSIAYEDTDGFFHFVVFDAVPRSQYMKGVTPHEAAKNIPKNVKWAVFLDGGQSSRITYVNDPKTGDIGANGNTQYLRLHERHKSGQGLLDAEGEHQYLWSRKGRPVPSVISVHLPNID